MVNCTSQSGCGNAVGKTDSNYLAITITPSPHKRHNNVCYKHLIPSDQEYVIMNALTQAKKTQSFELMNFNFEKCPTSGNTHLHGTIKITGTFQSDSFGQSIQGSVGYSGVSNKREHFIVISSVHNLEGWKEYCDKEKAIEYTISQIPNFNVFKITPKV